MLNDQEHKQSAMIALLPTTTDWCRIKLPHLTLVYAGEIGEDRSPMEFNNLAKDACSLAMMCRRLTLEVTGKEVFGNWSTDPDNQVDVFTLRATDDLLGMRHFVERWNASEFKDYKPHVTIGPVGSYVGEQPRFLSFDRIVACWGDKDLTFRLHP